MALSPNESAPPYYDVPSPDTPGATKKMEFTKGPGNPNTGVCTKDNGFMDWSVIDPETVPTQTGDELITVNSVDAFGLGKQVALKSDGAHLADNTDSTKFSVGFAVTESTPGNPVTVNLSRGAVNSSATGAGLTDGSIAYLGTAGDTTNTAPTAPGTIVQELGLSLSATSYIQGVVPDFEEN